jgi:hypothetical protein
MENAREKPKISFWLCPFFLDLLLLTGRSRNDFTCHEMIFCGTGKRNEGVVTSTVAHFPHSAMLLLRDLFLVLFVVIAAQWTIGKCKRAGSNN